MAEGKGEKKDGSLLKKGRADHGHIVHKKVSMRKKRKTSTLWPWRKVVLGGRCLHKENLMRAEVNQKT